MSRPGGASFVAQGSDSATGLPDMPSFVPSVPALMSKLATVCPGNAGTRLPSVKP